MFLLSQCNHTIIIFSCAGRRALKENLVGTHLPFEMFYPGIFNIRQKSIPICYNTICGVLLIAYLGQMVFLKSSINTGDPEQGLR